MLASDYTKHLTKEDGIVEIIKFSEISIVSNSPSNDVEEFVRIIECKCGQFEEFPADMPRKKAQTFTHIRNFDDNEALYRCECGGHVISNCEVVNAD